MSTLDLILIGIICFLLMVIMIGYETNGKLYADLKLYKNQIAALETASNELTAKASSAAATASNMAQESAKATQQILDEAVSINCSAASQWGIVQAKGFT